MSFHFAARNPVSKWRWDTLLTKEPATIAWIDAMPEGSVLWDIGANIGIYSIYAAARGLEVVAVEPVPQHFAELCENIKLNGLEDRVTACCMALTSHNGAEVSVKKMVPRMTLDTLARALVAHPTHIKIDTDGADFAVLLGAQIALTHAKSVIVEVDESNGDASRIRDVMNAREFVCTGRHICPFFPHSPIGMDHWARTQENL